MDILKEKLIQLESGFWEDAGADGDFYKENMADDGLMILPFQGGRMMKEATIESVQQAVKWKSFEINEAKVYALDDRYALLVYTTLAFHADDSEYKAHISTTYRKEGENWKLFIHQQTPILM